MSLRGTTKGSIYTLCVRVWDRRFWAVSGVVLGACKMLQVAADPLPMLFHDSGGFLANAYGMGFDPFRSYVYAWWLRAIGDVTHQFAVVTALQAAMGWVSAMLLILVCRRYFGVGKGVALGVGLLFAWDPVQVAFEHMVMTEAPSMLAIAALLTASLEYLRTQRSGWLVAVAGIGVVLASLRFAYVPVVLASAVVLPVLGAWGSAGKRREVLLWGFVASVASTGAGHVGYRALTGYLAGREPAYHYFGGFHTLGAVSPLVRELDAPDAESREVLRKRLRELGPIMFHERSAQVWKDHGLAQQLRRAYGDSAKAEWAAGQLARNAVWRDPLGAARGWARSALDYIRRCLASEHAVKVELGAAEAMLWPDNLAAKVRDTFRVDTKEWWRWMTPSRQYLVAARWWYAVLLMSPVLLVLGVLARAESRVSAVWLVCWAGLVFASITAGSVEVVYRYWHPNSWLLGVGVAGVMTWVVRRSGPLDADVAEGGGFVEGTESDTAFFKR